MTTPDKKLKTCIVGCKRGASVASGLLDLEEYSIAAVCDLNKELAEEAAANLGGIASWTDFEAMLEAEKPDVVYIATNAQPRARLSIAAAKAGVKGIIAEKPMAMSMGEARAMVEACEQAKARMIVTHQRRMGSDLTEMRALLQEGAIGDVSLIRASCGGDHLTDGTHAIDSVRWLVGDEPALWVLGQVFREASDEPGAAKSEKSGTAKHTGFRYGHAIETGSMSLIQFESGIRAEIFTGVAQVSGRAYQDYEVFGSKGRLWRPGDRGQLKILTDEGSGWQDVQIRPENERKKAMSEAWITFARQLRDGGTHPLAAEQGLKDHELVMAIFESARLNRRIRLPLEQDSHPLLIMIEEGRL